jgi:large subunit ribosomal protein L21
MYAVIRAGGKQYRVAPGDVIRIETTPASDGKVEFNDVLAVSADAGQLGLPQSKALVTGTVLEEGRADKILVFHFKRKKQYKKLRGHRQNFSAVRITEIAFDGQKFTAPDLAAKKAKPPKAEVEPTEAAGAKAPEKVVHKSKAHAAAAKHAAGQKKKSASKKKAAPKKGSSSHKKGKK